MFLGEKADSWSGSTGNPSRCASNGSSLASGVRCHKPCVELLALLVRGRVAGHRQQGTHQGDNGVIGSLLPIREGLCLQQAPPVRVSRLQRPGGTCRSQPPKETHLPLPVAHPGPQRA